MITKINIIEIKMNNITDLMSNHASTQMEEVRVIIKLISRGKGMSLMIIALKLLLDVEELEGTMLTTDRGLMHQDMRQITLMNMDLNLNQSL
jgi:hypothetical protein